MRAQHDARVLIVDDREAVGAALRLLLGVHGIGADVALSPEEGLRMLELWSFDLVIHDMNFSRGTTSGLEGVELFQAIRRREPGLPIILITAWGRIEQAVELVKAGAADYFTKPWNDEKLVISVKNLLELRAATRQQEQHTERLRRRWRELAARADLCGGVFESDAMLSVISIAVQVAASDVPVLITGDPGVGKEKVAEIIHANSDVRDGPFLKINMGALPHELMESELFGAEQGAFTGAHKSRAGRFEVADGGTMFLDELGNLSLGGQMKLLRVLETGEFERLGSTRTRKAIVRVVAATNTDLPSAIAEGAFREDLYYRINVIELEVPPLRERPEDILPLARSFAPAGVELSADAVAALQRYPWPGNVRELQNAMRRGAVLARDRVITAEALGLGGAYPVAGGSGPGDRATAVRVRDALSRNGGNVAAAARQLGMSRQALYRRIRRHGINGSGNDSEAGN